MGRYSLEMIQRLFAWLWLELIKNLRTVTAACLGGFNFKTTANQYVLYGKMHGI